MKQTLTLNITPEFYLLALVTPLRYYRFCYFLNQYLNIDFTMRDPLAIQSFGDGKLLQFYFYQYQDPIQQLIYKLVANKCEGGSLIPELKRVDYFLMLEGEFAADELRPVEQQLKSASCVQAVYQIDPNQLKSWKNLITE